MKKIMIGLALVASFAACKQNKSEIENTSPALVQDSYWMNSNSVLADRATEAKAYKNTSAKRTALNTSSNSYSNSNASVNADAPVATKKKGWSHRAKGAAVGAGTGAITGAIINKNNRGVGAVAGAVIGAASGYIIGNEVDKKKGR